MEAENGEREGREGREDGREEGNRAREGIR